MSTHQGNTPDARLPGNRPGLIGPVDATTGSGP